EFASCYFEVWMLRLAGVFPDLFSCSICARAIGIDEDRFLAAGLQAVICEACDHRGANSFLSDVAGLVYHILKNPLDTGSLEADRATRNLHELNEYWIRHYQGQ